MEKTLLILSCCLLLGFTAFAQKDASGKTDAPKQKKWLELDFSLKGGFYNEELQIELLSPGAKIFYTTNGEPPTYESTRYQQPIKIKETTVLRAIAYKAKRKSKTKANTYFINEPATTFPTISIAISDADLFDEEAGLFMDGYEVQDSSWRKEGANFWSRKEILTNCEIFESDGKREFNSITGFRLFGGMSRLFPQKSMTIVTRDRYGKKRISHKIFGKDGLKKHKFLVLRNSGSDFGKSHFRDAFMTSLLDDWDIEKQDYRSTHVYINGRYWGIYNIREKINRYFLEGHTDLDKDSIDLIEHRMSLKRGSTKHYRRMLNFLEENSMANEANYAHLQTLMEVENFMDYQIAQMFFDNQDAGGNIKFWRPQAPAGRWRWILYDTDWGFGLHNPEAYKNNSIAFHLEPEGPAWPNPPWSTLIMRKLMENPDFKQAFINRFADHLNTTFESEHVVESINRFYKDLEPEMYRHLDRWNLREKTWLSHIERMRIFGWKRPEYVRTYLQEMFELGHLSELQASSSAGGRIVINENIVVNDKGFVGQYFEKVPIYIQAIPEFGYKFSHWDGIEIDNDVFDITMLPREKKYNIRAVFEKSLHPLTGQILINEISCNDKHAGDWIELYNNSDEEVMLEDWILTDKKHFYKLPYIYLKPDSYLTVCEDTTAFRNMFPDVKGMIVGNFNFGLSKRKERLGFFTNEGASIDSVFYDIEPKDTTFTIGLLLPHLDNSDLENWDIKKGAGTPNEPNPYYLESRIKAEQELWVRVGIGIGLLLICFLALAMKRRKTRKAA